MKDWSALADDFENFTASHIVCGREYEQRCDVIPAVKLMLVAASVATLVCGVVRVHAQAERPAAIPVDVVVPAAPHALSAAGQRNFLYELHITNFGRSSLTVDSVEALDPAGTALATYKGDALDLVVARPGTPDVPKKTIGPGLRAVVFIDVSMPASSPCPGKIRHRITFEPVETLNAPMQSVVEASAVATVCGSPPAFGPPLRGGGWVALHALSNSSIHRRTLLAIDGRARIGQRFAIDFTKIGSDGQVFHGDPAVNSNWVPYGAEVLAIADGKVVEMQDGIPENNPTSATRAVPITLKTVGGNYVILDVGEGEYVFYAHLKPGSIVVKPGERVRRGQVLAKLGNSGQADAPHLHIHVMDAPSPMAAEGLPLVFERFDVEGHLPSLSVLTDGQGWRPSAPPRSVQDEMPLENDVVGFPK
jgi:murein DD-endopeptidase